MTRDTPTTSSRRLVSALAAMLAAIAVWSMVPAAHAAFPGTNGNIAFGSARNGFPADNDLYTMANNGTAQTRITSLNLDELNPAWSPNGLKIAYERTNGMRSDIWVANADGTNQVQLTNHVRNDTRPTWSNTGKKIVFASDRNGAAGTSDLFIMDSNGANQVAITNTPTINEDYPAYSPDGSAIAFTRNGDIYKASPNGTNLTRLTTATSDDIEPDWSPTANQIVYRVGQPFDEIWKMNADGTGKVDISNTGSEVEERPAWSPQGDKIAYIRGAFKDAEVYTMNADGTGQTRITTNTFMDASTAWQPNPRPVPYVRPKGASPLRASLVPSYRACKTPNRVHSLPLNGGSCSPPKLASRYLTVGTPDANGQPLGLNASVKIDVVPGDAGTPEDEADVSLQIVIPDVRKTSDLSDYTGQVRVRAEYRRQTDKENSFANGSPIYAATSTDVTWQVSVQCTATASTTIGSDCNLTTSRDAITPGSIKENKRAILTLGRIQVWDGGADGLNSTTVNDLFLTQGIFIP